MLSPEIQIRLVQNFPFHVPIEFQALSWISAGACKLMYHCHLWAPVAMNGVSILHSTDPVTITAFYLDFHKDRNIQTFLSIVDNSEELGIRGR